MHVSTTKYEWSHGRKPRGRGWWLFKVPGSDILGGKVGQTLFEAEGTYTEGKRDAIRQAKAAGVAELEVCP